MKTKDIKRLMSFELHLKQELKNPEFKRLYDQAGVRLGIVYQVVQLRKKHKISQAQLAKKLGTTQSNVARLEAGQRDFTLTNLQKIATVFKRNLKIEFV
jgi:DNA-binding XRE family transcriptional regulator